MTKPFFKAVHRGTGETIEFDLSDIFSAKMEILRLMMHPEKGIGLIITLGGRRMPVGDFEDWLKDYDLFYFHEGEYFDYEVK